MIQKSALYIGLILLLASCSVTKKLPAGESLYTGADIKIKADSSIKKSEIERVNAELAEFVRPKPNTAIMGFPYRVWLYYVMGEPRKPKGFRTWFRRKFGEPPVLASRGVINANTKQINVLLNNQGFFVLQHQVILSIKIA
jgi:hypothetical protein